MTERPTPNYSDAERELRRVEGIESAKMQDRTRAIVDAAERLARAMNLDVSPHGYARYDLSLEDGLTPEADDALLVLARALALPAEPAPAWTRTPPSEDGFWLGRDHTPLPNWEKRIFLYERSGGVWYGPLTSGDIKLKSDEVADLEFWPVRIKAARVSTPKWTKQPPTEPGYYWFRYHDRGGGPWIVCLSCIAGVRWWLWHAVDARMDDAGMLRMGGEWWPVPIQPPEET